jgi:ATP-dependent helicase HrpA
LRKEINRLVPKNFPEIYDSERLSHIPRYLKAIKIRAQRGSVFLSKDKSKEEKLKVFTDYMEKLSADMPSYSSEEKKNALAAYSWMIEEYKISLFAPELKTPFPVSRKRLEEKIREIERMI